MSVIKNKPGFFLLFLLIIFLFILESQFHLVWMIISYINRPPYYSVQRVLDGDTILLKNGQEVRYLGINSPELSHNGKEAECYATEAAEYNKKLLEGKKLRLVQDAVDKDHFGRLLRYVFTDDNLFINRLLLQNGSAQLLEIPPVPKFTNIFFTDVKNAKKQELGIWSHCFKKQDQGSRKQKCITTNNIANYIGEKTCVEYIVRKINRGKNETIWLENGLMANGRFTMTIFPFVERQFSPGYIEALLNKQIRVFGYVEWYNDRQTMILTDKSRMKIIE